MVRDYSITKCKKLSVCCGFLVALCAFFFVFFFFFFAIQNIYVNSKPATVNFEHVIVGWILTKKTAVDEII